MNPREFTAKAKQLFAEKNYLAVVALAISPSSPLAAEYDFFQVCAYVRSKIEKEDCVPFRDAAAYIMQTISGREYYATMSAAEIAAIMDE